MSFHKTSIARVFAWSLTIALVANGPLLSAEQNTTSIRRGQTPDRESVMQDVKLQAEGILTTRVVDVQGKPIVGEHVSVLFQGKEIAAMVSDDDGFATASGLRPGLHAIVTPTGTTVCRLWNADTAPPTSTSVPAVVSDSEVIRGQFGAFNLPMAAAFIAAGAGIYMANEAQNTADDTQKENAALAARLRALETASP